MKKLFGLCAIMALITGGVVLSDEVASIVEQNADDAAQAVESAVNDSNAAPIQEALPEQEAAPEQSVLPAAAEVVEENLPESSQTIQPAPNAPYVLGVIASPVPPMVRAQVNIPEESGLFVQTIKPNGPAAKAGVLPYDIILSVDGTAVSNTIDLAAAIQKAAGKPQKLTVLRQGKELTFDITAQLAEAPRLHQNLRFGKPVPPMHQPFMDPMAPNYDPDEDDDNLDPSFPRIHQFMERQRLQMEQMRQRMEAIENAMRQGPGAVPAPAPNGTMVLPPPQKNNPNVQIQGDSFSVQVQKNGNEPAIIKIKENGNEYTVDENSIDQLPENVRNRLNLKIQINDK